MAGYCMQEHEFWLGKAASDLKSAKTLSNDEDTADNAIYHTQQCAEKALKGYLVFKKQPILKTHDLELLLKLCINFDNEFFALREEAAFLKPYGIIFRYPDSRFFPKQQEVFDAIKKAKKVFNFVKDKIGYQGEINLRIFQN
jgi:HEPN domain-containing protein